eukprot:6193205-Pleurochrysis_carterae.AAC.2
MCVRTSPRTLTCVCTRGQPRTRTCSRTRPWPRRDRGRRHTRARARVLLHAHVDPHPCTRTRRLLARTGCTAAGVSPAASSRRRVNFAVRERRRSPCARIPFPSFLPWILFRRLAPLRTLPLTGASSRPLQHLAPLSHPRHPARSTTYRLRAGLGVFVVMGGKKMLFEAT